MKYFLGLLVLLANAATGQAQTALIVVDAKDKIVGPVFGTNKVIITIGDGRIVFVGFTPDGFTEDGPFFLYRTKGCQGDAYIGAGTQLPEGIYLRDGVTYMAAPKRRMINWRSYKPYGEPCRDIGGAPYPTLAGLSVTTEIKALGLTPPFRLKLR